MSVRGVPASRWGEAMGLQGLCYSLGFALGPATGSYLRMYYSFDILFYTSSFFALLSVLVILGMKETLEHREKFGFNKLHISRKDIIATEVLTPAIVVMLSYSAFGVILNPIPDWSIHLGVASTESFFIFYTLSSLLARIVAVKFSDRHGRIPVVRTGLGILAVALVLIALASSFFSLMSAAFVYGMSMGVLSPALSAWTIDQKTGHRGKAVATMYIALEAGIGLGALFSGTCYGNVPGKIPAIMLFAAFLILITLFYTLTLRNKKSFTSKQG